MSTETDTKKSFLTNAMENARAKMADNTEATEENPGMTADRKQFMKRALIATAVTVVVTALAVKLLPKAADEEEMTEETPQD